ncbi:hypothetical protein [Luteolibacter soli]|uniref:Uncharacterized protein n=1 Tax=Luteolibacter soli TaxID=3135280 RepID=A0ABU9AV87_9BACT
MRLPLIFAAAALIASCSGPTSSSEPVVDATAPASSKPLSINPPSHWKVVMDKPGFPIAMCVFQIPNPADKAGKNSTNVVVGAYQANSKQAQDALAGTKRRFVKTSLQSSRKGAWDIESYAEIEGVTRYRILDGTQVLPDKTLFIRFAWPNLPGNAPSYDADMARAFDNLLGQVH